MVRYYILALTLLLIAFGSPARLVGDEAPPCSGSGVYKPLTLYRKVQLATAYFVNTALPDKAKIADVYTLNFESVSADERQELIKNLGETDQNRGNKTHGSRAKGRHYNAHEYWMRHAVEGTFCC